MKYKKYILPTMLGIGLLVSGAASVNAGSYAIHFSTRNLADDTDVVTDVYPDSDVDKLLVINHSSKLPEAWGTDTSLVFENGVIRINPAYNFSRDQVDMLSPMLDYLFSSMTTASSTNTTQSSQISTLQSLVDGLGAPFSVATFMANDASTSPYIASSTKNGFLSATDKAKLDAISTSTWSWSSPSHSIVTGTGATGFQVSSTRNSTARYTVKVTTTASIAGNADGDLRLEIAPTNSATAGDWVEAGRCGNSQALTLAITLQSVQAVTCQIVGDIPAGYYAKLRSVTTTGTVSFAYVSGQEVLK